ncbi:MAG: hypothetical protein ACRYFX_29280 [Janthinobacterium lividum]
MLRTTLGVVETACQRTGIGRTTHYRWLKADKKYAAEVADIEEVALDFGVTQLHKLMGGYTLPDSKVFLVDHIELKGGKTVTTKKPLVVPLVKHHGPDASAVIFFLKSKGKKRGYVERNEVTGKDGAPVVPAAVSFTIEVLPSGPSLASSEKEVDDV